jgi:alkylhydroperoxidase family enzyme
MLFAAISKDRNCHYCAAAHIACCRMLGVKQSLLDDLVRDVNSISVPEVRDMILFGLKCSRDPQQLSEADYEKLRQHKLSQSEILELIAMSGLAVYANILADCKG